MLLALILLHFSLIFLRSSNYGGFVAWLKYFGGNKDAFANTQDEDGKVVTGDSKKKMFIDHQYTLSDNKMEKLNLIWKENVLGGSLCFGKLRVENKIWEIKIMLHVYCNFQKKLNMRFNIISAIINLKHALD